MSMVYSSPDMLALVAELNTRRIPRTYGDRFKRLGGMLLLSEKERALLMNARRMHHRYEQGDYRHTNKEAGRIKELMEILLLHHAENRGGKPGEFRWPVDNGGWLVSQVPQQTGMYDECVRMVLTEW